jgi:Ribbon-helix-helix domain
MPVAERARWNIAVSPDTDRSVRMCLAEQGHAGRKGELSNFIENAARAYVFDWTVQQAKAANAQYSEAQMDAMIDEAVNWARA